MAQHTRISRFATRIRDRREERETRMFDRESQRLERQEVLEERRAKIRKLQAIARPKGASTTGRGLRGFAQDFAARQQQPTLKPFVLTTTLMGKGKRRRKK